MFKFARYLYYKYDFVNLLFNKVHTFYLFFRDIFVDEKDIIKQRFKKSLKMHLNLENPKTLNEKINWLKLYDRTTLHTSCADKIKVRDYVADKVGSQFLIPLVFKSYDVNDLIPENFPDEPFIIKANHDSSGGVIVRAKKDVDWVKLRKTFRKLLKRNYYHIGKEWQYKNIEPGILAEKLLQLDDGSIPFDYKMHYFNGELAFVQVDIDRQIDHKRNLYDKDWNFLDVEWIYKNGTPVEKPICYEEMKTLSKTLAQDFSHVRIDLYALENKIYFGEMTFHSESGFGAFKPKEWDLKFGELLTLPK